MRILSAALLGLAAVATGAAQSRPAAPAFSHALWDQVLKAHVSHEGRVDYSAIRRDARFHRYVNALAVADDARWPDARHRLAFWINAYNALTIHGILSHLPADPRALATFKPTSVKVGGKSFWQGPRFRVAGRTLTLDEIEHSVIRREPELRDPRVHVALVCAARGCPPLMNRAYTGAELERQLEARTRREFNDPSRTRIDRKRKVIRLSRVFEWFGQDFTDTAFKPHADTLTGFIARYLEDRELAASLTAGGWKVAFYPYDWRLNVTKTD